MDHGPRFIRPRLLAAMTAILLSLSAACGGAAPPAPGSGTGGNVGNFAPEFSGIAHWINTSPLTMEELRGKVVLIDFWTYTCVNCIRTMPYLREWQAKYGGKGLVIVGVHAPEFEFEKVTANVERATAKFELTYPIAQDNEFGTWRAYGNRFWPAKYLVDKDGVVRYRHFGEGAYVEMEKEVRRLLTDAGYDVASVPIGEDDGPVAERRSSTGEDMEDRMTREIYGGYLRNATIGGLYVAQVEYYDGPDRVLDYKDLGYYNNQFIHLQGLWLNGAEALKHARVTTGYEDYIAFRFLAATVNAVVGYADTPYEVEVTMNGRPLMPEEAGPDVKIEADRSYVLVDEAKMYELVALGRYGTGVVRLSSNSDQFEFFALTFGPYLTGP